MDTMLIAAVVFLVVGSAFFSSAEIAYNSASSFGPRRRQGTKKPFEPRRSTNATPKPFPLCWWATIW
jgi:hypothetical protein